MENLKNVFKSNFLKDLDKEKNMDLSFESTEHNIYYPDFSSGNVTPRVVDHEPEDYNFNDYLGGLPEIKKKINLEEEYQNFDFLQNYPGNKKSKGVEKLNIDKFITKSLKTNKD